MYPIALAIQLLALLKINEAFKRNEGLLRKILHKSFNSLTLLSMPMHIRSGCFFGMGFI